jgi:hypothetical protein
MKQILVVAILCFANLSAFPQKTVYHDSFTEDFDNPTSLYFKPNSEGKKADFTCKSGVRTLLHPWKKILALKIDPEEKPGAGVGPEIISKGYTHFGTYSARLKVPDVRKKQPDAGAVIGYFTYNVDSVPGLSEIDFEWLVADPEIIYVGTWTGERGNLKRIGRTLNLASGKIYNTSYREMKSGFSEPLKGEQNQPEFITPVKDYDASARFYTYGFDWHPDGIRWWMLNSSSRDTVVLWDYKGSSLGIPQNRSRYRMNFWYTDKWAVETNPKSTERPKHRYRTEIDWMSYVPYYSVTASGFRNKQGF